MKAEAMFSQIGVEGTDFKISAEILQKKEFSEEDTTILNEFSLNIAKQFCYCNMYADCIIKNVMAIKMAITKFYSIIVKFFKTHPNETMVSLYSTGTTEFEETDEYIRIYMLKKPTDEETLYLKFEYISDGFDGRLVFEPSLM